MAELLSITGRIFLGFTIFALGFYLAPLTYTITRKSTQKQANLFSRKVQIALIILVSLISLITICTYALVQIGVDPNSLPSPSEQVEVVRSYWKKPAIITRRKFPQSNQFKGFGFFPTFPHYNLNNRPGVIKSLFEEMKPHVIRIEFKANWSNGEGHIDRNDEELQRQIKLVKIAAEQGIKKWIAVHWSPPTEFRKYDSTKALVNGKDNLLREDKEDDYARYIAELVNTFVKAGTPAPYGISIQNELNYAPSWSGMKVPQDQFRRLVKLFRQELDAAGYGEKDTNFIRVQGPESGSIVSNVKWLGGRHFSYFKKDPEFAKALSDLLTHSYNPNRWSGGKYADNWRNGILYHSGGRDVWMTEMSHVDGNPSQMSVAITMSREIGKHIGYLHSNYWLFWGGWRPQQKGENYPREFLTLGEVSNNLPKRSKFYHVLRLLCNYTQPGSYVYSFRSQDSSLLDSGKETNQRYVDLLAFQGQSRSVILMVNDTSTDKDITVKGLSGMGSSVDIYRVSDRQDENGLKITSSSIDRSGSITKTIPLTGKSVVVLVTNGGIKG
ncbi:MAG: hypothetical protein WA919_23945 [Coleofasciculaceae cyanobacterium]